MSERMRLDQAIEARGLLPSRARARDAVKRGTVTVNGAIASKPHQMVGRDDIIALDDPAARYVSRAALKLIAGLDAASISPEAKICLDLGASTGGFTQVLLERGAGRVYAVDVGHEQLHDRLKGSNRVVSLEGVNGRDLDASLIPEPIALLVSDLSFVSVTKVIGPALRGGSDCPIVVMGAGTGFGVAGLARGPRGDLAVATEGGHAGFAPSDELEAEVWKRLAARFGRVSIERLLSGPGLYDLYCAMAQIRAVPADLPDERAVTEAGGRDPLAGDVLDRFCEIMGSVAGDLALTFGARGGVFVSGGIAPRLGERLNSGGFRKRFEDKGRLSNYVRDIPTSLVTHPYPAIIGAARELQQMERM